MAGRAVATGVVIALRRALGLRGGRARRSGLRVGGIRRLVRCGRLRLGRCGSRFRRRVGVGTSLDRGFAIRDRRIFVLLCGFRSLRSVLAQDVGLRSRLRLITVVGSLSRRGRGGFTPVRAGVTAAATVFAAACDAAAVDVAAVAVEPEEAGRGAWARTFANVWTDDTTFPTAVSGFCPLSTVPRPVVDRVATA